MAEKAALSREQIVDLLKVQRPDLLKEFVEPDYISTEELLELLTQALTPALLPGLAPMGELLVAGVTDQAVDIDLDGLIKDAGLIYHDHVQRTGKRPDGTEGLVWMRTERPMTGADVVSWRVEGHQVVLVTADGQKVTLEH